MNPQQMQLMMAMMQQRGQQPSAQQKGMPMMPQGMRPRMPMGGMFGMGGQPMQGMTNNAGYM